MTATKTPAPKTLAPRAPAPKALAPRAPTKAHLNNVAEAAAAVKPKRRPAAASKPVALFSTLTKKSAGYDTALTDLVVPPPDGPDHKDRGHALLSMSQAERYMVCPGSVLLGKSVTTPSRSSDAADEGTLAHTISEYLFRQVATGQPQELPPIPAKYDPHMLKHCEAYVTSVCALSGRSYIEAALDYSALHKNLGGTTDLINIDDGGLLLRVGDFKFGKSPVSAERNPQLMGYAVGARKTFKIKPKTIELRIYQPRAKNSVWTCSAAELDAFEAELVAAAHLTDDYFAPLKVSDKGCFWCKAKPICPEYLKTAQKAAAAEFAGPAPKAKTAAKIEPAKLVDAVNLAQHLLPWCEAVLQQAKDSLAQDAASVPGYALKPGRQMKKWTKEDELYTVVDNVLDTLRAADEDIADAIDEALYTPKALKAPGAALDAVSALPLFAYSGTLLDEVRRLEKALEDHALTSNAAASLVKAKPAPADLAPKTGAA